MYIRYIFFSALLFNCCTPGSSGQDTEMARPVGKTIEQRFALPRGYHRIKLADGSFGTYLRKLPLKPAGAIVHYYNGAEKPNLNVQAAVLDMEIGTQDLQQCADAVMRLRAEYLYSRKAYDRIHFNFTSGFRADYAKWREGYRIAVSGNSVAWVKKGREDTSYASFRKYLDMVFSYAGTLSLSKELKSIVFSEMQPGDILIQGGSPGHAVIVVDMAINQQGKQVYLLAQSYMPAQEIHLLRNPADPLISPWYELQSAGEIIETPEWSFRKTDLKRFPD